jgi:hypothetical protein
MTEAPHATDARRLRLVTRHGHVDGDVLINSRVATLRYLNVTAATQNFIVMSAPIEPSEGWNIVDGALALAVDSLLFVQELTVCAPFPSDRAAAAMYERCAIRLAVGDYAVEGYLHMPPGGNPISRLNQNTHPFFALSSVSVIGPETQFAAPFLAVKRSEVIALQAVGNSHALDEALEAEVVAPC